MNKYTELKRIFEENQDPENAVKMGKYMRNLFIFYGIPTPKRKKLYREFQYLVTDYLSELNLLLTYDDIPAIRKFIDRKQWWDTIDALDQVIGKIGLRDERVDALMLEWSEDANFWVRRVAIDHQLLRKERTNTTLLEKIIINNLGSSEFFINKAIGWSLRDYSKTDPEWVRDFIERYRDRMDKLSIREACKYIKE